MPAYKEYQYEAEIYKDVNEVKLNNEQALKISRKIERHFKINRYWSNKKPLEEGYLSPILTITFNRRTSSFAFLSRIEFRHNPDLLTVCHEMAHILSHRK